MFSRTHFVIFTPHLHRFRLSFLPEPRGSRVFPVSGSYPIHLPGFDRFWGLHHRGLLRLFSHSIRGRPAGLPIMALFEMGEKRRQIRERYSDALEEMMRGNIQQAKDTLSKILEKQPTHLPAPSSLANLYSLEGKYCRGHRYPPPGQSRRPGKSGTSLRPGEKQRRSQEGTRRPWKPSTTFWSVTRPTAKPCGRRETSTLSWVTGTKPTRPRRGGEIHQRERICSDRKKGLGGNGI